MEERGRYGEERYRTEREKWEEWQGAGWNGIRMKWKERNGQNGRKKNKGGRGGQRYGQNKADTNTGQKKTHIETGCADAERRHG
jgi:hypothetical protein